jgi:23S rRNA pseudouridine1911/1915/1917 synthase
MAAMDSGSRLNVLFEDEHCLAVVKPAGQFTQGSWAPPGERTLEQDVREHLDPADPASVYVGIVHRLDRAVSGVLIWAKNVRAARRLSKQFERRDVEKEYWAIVERSDPPGSAEGWDSTSKPYPETGVWTDWLTSPGVAGVARAVPEREPGARLAVTRFEREPASQVPQGCAWLRLWPETGRTHQLRVQSALRGMPILGDSNYGAVKSFVPGIALHARLLRVRHPTLHSPLSLVAPLPGAWGEQGIKLPEGEPAER